jgi:hypothetical protein
MSREIIYSHEFTKGVEALGGYRAVDRALESIMDGLEKNPYGFHIYESDSLSFRFAISKPIDDMPSLVVIFTITKNKDVTLEWIEENHVY